MSGPFRAPVYQFFFASRFQVLVLFLGTSSVSFYLPFLATSHVPHKAEYQLFTHANFCEFCIHSSSHLPDRRPPPHAKFPAPFFFSHLLLNPLGCEPLQTLPPPSRFSCTSILCSFFQWTSSFFCFFLAVPH